MQREPAHRQRAVDRLAQLRRRRPLRVRRRHGVGLLRRHVAFARTDGEPRPRHAYVDLVQPARPRIGRIVREHVVRAVVLDDALVGGREIVLVDHRETAGLVRQDAQAVLREPQLVLQRTGADPERRVVGVRLDLDRLVAEIGEAARVDAVDRDVGSGRRRDRVARRVHHHRRAVVIRSAARDHVVDVVVDPLADEEDRLAAPAHRSEPVGDVAQRVERVPRVEAALGVLGIVERIALLPEVARVVELARLVRGGRIELASAGLVHRGEQQPLVVRELLVGVGGAGGVHDGHQIVGAEPPLDELLGGRLHSNRAPEPRVQIVDHHDVDAAVERLLVRLHVGLDRRLGEERPIGALDRDVDHREGVDALRFSVLEHLEVFLLQVAHEVALAIGHHHVDLDVVDADLEGRALWRRRRRRLRGGLLPRVERRAGEKHEQRGESKTFMHG